MRQGPETAASVGCRSRGRSDSNEVRRLRLLAAAAQCRRLLGVSSEGRRGCSGLYGRASQGLQPRGDAAGAAARAVARSFPGGAAVTASVAAGGAAAL